MTTTAKFSDGSTQEAKTKGGKFAWAVKITVGDDKPLEASGFAKSQEDAEEQRGKFLAGLKGKGGMTFNLNEIVATTGDVDEEEEPKPEPKTKDHK